MPQRQRPSLSAPSYGAYTGRINWSRGMDEALAQAPAIAPPVQPASTPAATPSASRRQSGGGAGNAGDVYYARNRYFTSVNRF